MERSKVMFFVNCLLNTYCSSFYGSELWCRTSYGFKRCVIEWNKAREAQLVQW